MCKSNTRFKKGLIWYTMYKKVEQKKLFINQKQLIPNRDPNNHNTPEVCPIFYLLSHSNFECRFSQNVKKRHQFKKKKHKKQIHYLHLTINTFIILYRHEKACEKQT
ncbi:Protein not essential for viability [Candida albicans SC5314]|nr:hypothetical protein MEO_01474 [Candida albicans P94015]KHC66469.1 Protein not essential for viability [Candida albicans P75010]KHC81143.1 Protein not essential for viability [Candida albicans SC5314]KHC88633.1 Protein not essential for viability [Candida albicans SC5314]